ncbi:tetratricopeptide (TPR) repeat protein [Terracoccus luteus]|uniref:Tetratricopeptide (TPR) repeat protein n=1 Tax=Terracoccus luteus TaxID=53356 RepID=A0A495XX92_9MICO|nr:tetratricopeptide (TPR) repeat protein [Terracoccus luteus]
MEAAKPDIAVTGGIVGNIGDNGTVNMVMPRRQVSWPVVVGSPPPLASAFRSRSSVLDLMAGQADVVLRQVLSGDGGVGKSQIAAGAFDSTTVDLRVWVAAESRTAVITGFAQAAVQLDLADPGVDPERLAALFLGFVAGTDRSWLVVMDDVADPADLAGLWPAGTGRVVVTTRRRDASLSGGGRVMIDVGVYTNQEARGYLVDRLTPMGDRLPGDVLAEADALADDLGRLPLGLAHAAAVIIDQGVGCAQYRRWFADRSRALEELFPADADADGYAKTVATTWALAVEAADRMEPRGLASPMAALVAVFDPAGAPETVFTSKPARDWLTARTSRGDVTRDVARGALRALDRLSLVSHNPGQDAQAVRMHNLTGRAILHAFPAADIQTLALAAAESLLEVWPAIENTPTLSESLRANTASVERVSPAALWDAESGGHPVLFRAGHSLQEAGLARDAVAFHEQLLNRARGHLGPDHPDTLSSRNNLAGAYESAGDLARAIPLHEQTLTDRERVLGPDHPQTLTSRNNLAGAYESAGDLAQAIPLYEQTLTDRERVLGPDHPQTLTSRNNLAGAYESAGDLARAIPLHEQTLTDSERVLGPDHPQTLTSRNNLAGAYESAGDLAQAIPLYEQTLTDSERVLGPDHPQTLTSRNNLAYAYESAGDLGRAIPLYEQTLTDSERVLGPDHPHTLTSRNNLASAYRSAGDLGRAIPLYEQSVTDSERVLGPDHPQTLASRNNLASAYRSAGDLGRAIPLCEQTLTDSERVLGPDHPHTLTSRNNLAIAYRSAGDLGRAIPLYERTLTNRERVLGPHHPQTLISRNNLGSAYRSAGDLGRAIPLCEQTLTDSERVLGPDHPQTLASRNNLAIAYESAEDLGRAIPLYERTLTDSERVLGPHHPQTLISRSNLARAYESAGELG